MGKGEGGSEVGGDQWKSFMLGERLEVTSETAVEEREKHSVKH